MSDVKSLTIGVIGAHGKTGSLTLKALQKHGFESIVAFTRNVIDPKKDQTYDPKFIKQINLDLVNSSVSDLVETFKNIDIIIFAAGSGDQGVRQLFTVDVDGVSKCVEACERLAVKRFILTSVINVEERDFWWSLEGNLRDYFIAKRCADHEVRYSKLNWTILQPGWLSINNKPTGNIQPLERIEEQRMNGYTIEREDLAEVIISCLLNPQTTCMKSIPLSNGDTPIDKVIQNLK
ncbi:hypothetical protein MOUN0_D04038 [Monosporozyma unispora]|nr:hypothetical protein C6P44_000966 [Kazachstania unispora]